MAGIRSDMNLISNQVIEPISALKIQSLGHHNPRLHSDEVLIALAILSTVALLAVRVSGDSLTQLTETGWEDGVLRAGRGKMIQMLRESPDSLDQWGTLSPEYPDVEWHSKLIALRCMEGKRLEFRLVENRGTSSRELLLEYILPR